MTLPAADRALVEAARFDPDGEASFHAILACLVWPDEVPRGLTPDGHEYVRDLLAARGFIHRGVAIEGWGVGATMLADRWNEAIDAGLRWPGFRRIALSDADRRLLEAHLAEESIP